MNDSGGGGGGGATAPAVAIATASVNATGGGMEWPPRDYLYLCGGRYEPYETYVAMGVAALPVLAFGMLANAMSVRIFAHRAMRHAPINWYLLVLSASDCCVLLTSLLFLTLPRFGQVIGCYSMVRASYLLTPYLYALANLLQTNSVYMTVAVSAHRFIGVCFPFIAGRIVNERRVRIAIGSVVLFACMFNLPRFFEVQISADCYYEDIKESIPLLGPTKLRVDPTYLMLFHGWTYSLVMFFVPFAALIVMNSAVMAAIRRTRKMHAALMAAQQQGGGGGGGRAYTNGAETPLNGNNAGGGDECGGGGGGREQEKRRELMKELRTSVMLVAIVVLFLVCNALAFVLNVWENVTPGEHGWLYTRMVSASNFLIIVNASANIAIYSLFSHKYRTLLQYYACCRWTKADGDTMIPLNSMPER